MKRKSFILPLLLVLLFSVIGYVGYSIFNQDSYRISFDTMGGSYVNSIDVKKGQNLKKLPMSKKEGYEFGGWLLDGELFDFKNESRENITLTAKWLEEDDKYYTLKFDPLLGSEVADMRVKSMEKISDIPYSVRDGYEFRGWYYQNKEFDWNNGIEKNLTLVAKWEKIKD